MKKFYFLLSAACLVASASAAEKEMASSKVSVNRSSETQMSNSFKKDVTANAFMLNVSDKQKTATRAGEADYAYFRAADNVMAASMSTAGYGWNKPLGFASNYGEIVFNNYSTNLKSNVWQYGWYVKDATEMINVTDTDLAITPLLGRQMVDLSMNVEFNSGLTQKYTAPAKDYLCGGGLSFWDLKDGSHDDIYGVTFYQNSCYAPDGENVGFGSLEASYKPGAANFNAGGAYVGNTNGSWQKTFNQHFEGKTVSNLALEQYYILQPKPASTYFMTTGWIWLNTSAATDTQLISYIYPIDEEGNINEEAPIALGYAAIPKGSSAMIKFYYNPLNEDGDELEGEVFIDSAVAISIEGFQGNEAITSLTPVSGYMPFDYEVYTAGNYDLCKDSNIRFIFSMNVDGEPVEMISSMRGLYGVLKDEPNLVTSIYAQYSMDATFAYILTADGEDTIVLPSEGGNADVALDALYYVTNDMVEAGYYEIEAPEWLTVTVGDPDRENGISYINIACAAGEKRSGIVSVKGFGITLDITVNQGAGNGDSVEVVKAEKGAVYYDLAGRRVVNPDKGVYVKVNGNKTEKVIL